MILLNVLSINLRNWEVLILNKILFSTYFKYKDYEKCVILLRREIINILCCRVKEKNPNFVYTNISNLKLNCFKYLSELEQEIVIQLYDFSFDDVSIDYELSCMFEIYDSLKNK